MEKRIDQLSGHIILCGIGRVGEQVLTQLMAENVPVVVIDRAASEKLALLKGAMYVEGDATEDAVLQKAGIQRSNGLVATLPEDAQNVFVTLTARGLNPKLQIVARAEREESEEKLRRAGANKVINPYSIGGRKIAMTIRKPISVDYVDTILHDRNREFSVEEMMLHKDSVIIGKTLRELKLREVYGVTLLAVKRQDEIIGNPSPDFPLHENDLVIVYGSREQLMSFEHAVKAV